MRWRAGLPCSHSQPIASHERATRRRLERLARSAAYIARHQQLIVLDAFGRRGNAVLRVLEDGVRDPGLPSGALALDTD